MGALKEKPAGAAGAAGALAGPPKPNGFGASAGLLEPLNENAGAV